MQYQNKNISNYITKLQIFDSKNINTNYYLGNSSYSIKYISMESSFMNIPFKVFEILHLLVYIASNPYPYITVILNKITTWIHGSITSVSSMLHYEKIFDIKTET